MTSWRDALRQRQLAIDAADREELEANKKTISSLQESIDSENSYSDVCAIPVLSTPCTAPAAVRLLAADVTDAQLLNSDDLPIMHDNRVAAEPATCSSGVETSSADHRQVADAESDVTEVNQQLSPADGAHLTDELKSDVDCVSDGGSLHSIGCTESDQISSSAVDSCKSIPSTPEHLISAEVSPTRNVLNCTSESSEIHFADEVPKPFAETATAIDHALDVQSPVHKRTRRHGRRRGAHHAKKKHSSAVEQVESKPADNVTDILQESETHSNDRCSKPSDVHLTSMSEELELDEFQSQPSDSELVADAAVTDDLTAQVVRHASYLKAVSTGSESPITHQLQSNLTESTVAAVAQATEDHFSSHGGAKSDGKYILYDGRFFSVVFSKFAVISHIDTLETTICC